MKQYVCGIGNNRDGFNAFLNLSSFLRF